MRCNVGSPACNMLHSPLLSRIPNGQPCKLFPSLLIITTDLVPFLFGFLSTWPLFICQSRHTSATTDYVRGAAARCLPSPCRSCSTLLMRPAPIEILSQGRWTMQHGFLGLFGRP